MSMDDEWVSFVCVYVSLYLCVCVCVFVVVYLCLSTYVHVSTFLSVYKSVSMSFILYPVHTFCVSVVGHYHALLKTTLLHNTAVQSKTSTFEQEYNITRIKSNT